MTVLKLSNCQGNMAIKSPRTTVSTVFSLRAGPAVLLVGTTFTVGILTDGVHLLPTKGMVTQILGISSNPSISVNESVEMEALSDNCQYPEF